MRKIIFVLISFLLFSGCESLKRKSVDLSNRSPANAQEAKELQLKTAEYLNIPVEKSVELDDFTKMEFVLIPAGEFYMGSLKSEAKRSSDESPLHKVKISKPFYMGKYEVTQMQYAVITESTKKRFYTKGYNNPADRISYNKAISFATKFSIIRRDRDLVFRLPTEAEWEYACRAGTTTPFYTGETINPDQANYKASKVYGDGLKGIYLEKTTVVGKFAPNAFGLYDMHGNVWEWCIDRYQGDFYKVSPVENPQSGGDGPIRRGGGWDEKPDQCRSANRDHLRWSWQYKANTGFRLVLEIK